MRPSQITIGTVVFAYVRTQFVTQAGSDVNNRAVRCFSRPDNTADLQKATNNVMNPLAEVALTELASNTTDYFTFRFLLVLASCVGDLPEFGDLLSGRGETRQTNLVILALRQKVEYPTQPMLRRERCIIKITCLTD